MLDDEPSHLKVILIKGIHGCRAESKTPSHRRNEELVQVAEGSLSAQHLFQQSGLFESGATGLDAWFACLSAMNVSEVSRFMRDDHLLPGLPENEHTSA